MGKLEQPRTAEKMMEKFSRSTQGKGDVLRVTAFDFDGRDARASSGSCSEQWQQAPQHGFHEVSVGEYQTSVLLVSVLWSGLRCCPVG